MLGLQPYGTTDNLQHFVMNFGMAKYLIPLLHCFVGDVAVNHQNPYGTVHDTKTGKLVIYTNASFTQVCYVPLTLSRLLC